RKPTGWSCKRGPTRKDRRVRVPTYASIVVGCFVSPRPHVYVVSSLCCTSEQRKTSRAHRAPPEQGGSAGASECQARDGSWPEKKSIGAGPAPVCEGQEAG